MVNTSMLRLICLCAIGFQSAFAGVATVYYPHVPTATTGTPSPFYTEAGTTHLSAIGTGENGRTRYEMEMVRSLLVLDINGRPETVISIPITRTFTLEENDSQLRMSATPVFSDGILFGEDIGEDCDMDLSKMTAECIERYLVVTPVTRDGSTRTVSYTDEYTYDATLRPLATFTSDGSSWRLSHSSMRVAFLVGSASVMSLLALV